MHASWKWYVSLRCEWGVIYIYINSTCQKLYVHASHGWSENCKHYFGIRTAQHAKSTTANTYEAYKHINWDKHLVVTIRYIFLIHRCCRLELGVSMHGHGKPFLWKCCTIPTNTGDILRKKMWMPGKHGKCCHAIILWSHLHVGMSIRRKMPSPIPLHAGLEHHDRKCR